MSSAVPAVSSDGSNVTVEWGGGLTCFFRLLKASRFLRAVVTEQICLVKEERVAFLFLLHSWEISLGFWEEVKIIFFLFFPFFKGIGERMASLPGCPLHLARTQLLQESTKYIKDVGFTYRALSLAMKSIGTTKDLYSRGQFAQMFDRGFPSALVEHVVRSGNAAVERDLESRFGKENIIKDIVKNEAMFVAKTYQFPTSRDVACAAIKSKIQSITPFAAHWSSAVALEMMPANLPYTMMNNAEFVDTTAFYMERVDKLKRLLVIAQQLLHARSQAASILPENNNSWTESTTDFLHAVVKDISLSSGPHAEVSVLNYEWFGTRAKIGALYMASALSLMGDVSLDKRETHAFIESIVF